MNKRILLFVLPCIFILIACNKGVDSPAGFSLPEGNAEAGKLAFLKHQCISCHSIGGIEYLPDEMVEREHEPAIVLGSNSAIVKTYADLVTSIINPSHRISRGARWRTSDESGNSLMPNYNDVLTVTELIDLVAYIQPHYEVTPWPYTAYPIYGMYPQGMPKTP